MSFESRYEELRASLEADCKKVVGDTVHCAREGIQEFKEEEQNAVRELREQCTKQEEQAADLNFQLQEGIDELADKRNKQNFPTSRIEDATQEATSVPIEVFATPMAAHPEARATLQMSNLADESKESLHSILASTQQVQQHVHSFHPCQCNCISMNPGSTNQARPDRQ